MDNLRKTIGYRIVDALAFKNLRQKDLAKELGVKDHIISYFASGERTPNTEQLVKIAQFLGVTTDYLLGLSNNRTLENAGIGAETGLSDDAIQSIKQNKDNFFCSQGLDMIARDPLLCSMIAEYCFGQAAQFLSHSDYRRIPLKVSYLPELLKIKFAEIMEYLPRMRQEVEEIYTDDFDFIDKLYLNYLSIYGNITELAEQVDAIEEHDALAEVWREVHGKEPTEHELAESFHTVLTDEEASKLEMKYQAELAEDREITKKVLLFASSRKNRMTHFAGVPLVGSTKAKRKRGGV